MLCLAVVAATCDVLADDLRAHAALLSAREHERAAALRLPQARDDFIAAHALVRHVAAALAGADAAGLTVVQRCARCGGAHGVPRLAERPDLHISLSHAQGVVAAAAAWAPVAIDLQHADDGWRLAELGLTPQQWMRRECLVKLGLAELDDPPPEALPAGWVETAWAGPAASALVVSLWPAVFGASHAPGAAAAARAPPPSASAPRPPAAA